jgi:hypothetical protein
MIRTIMDVAERPYERWYVIAHSLGTVVAFNGLMETAYAWPGYFDEKRWTEASTNRLAGPARASWPIPDEETMPRRPVWAPRTDIAYRSKIFRNFHGFLTFGCPLEKFATIWPAKVPISKEPAFRSGVTWLNVFDPIDPVSGVLRAFEGNTSCCPQPINIGYAAGDILLLSHVQYLDKKPDEPLETDGVAERVVKTLSRTPKTEPRQTLADGVAEWLVTGNAAKISADAGPQWFAPYSRRHKRRSVTAWIWWILVVLALAALGGIAAPVVWEAIRKSAVAIGSAILPLLGWVT